MYDGELAYGADGAATHRELTYLTPMTAAATPDHFDMEHSMLHAMETAAARLEAEPNPGMTWAAGMEMASKQAAAAAEAAHAALSESQRRAEVAQQQGGGGGQQQGGGVVRRPQPVARPKVSKKEAEAAAARLYSGGGRKGFAALKERSAYQRVHAAVGVLWAATVKKPCDTEVVGRTIARADQAMLSVICALFEREVGEPLGAALLRLGESDAKVVLCGLVDQCEQGRGSLPADKELAEEQAALLHEAAIDEATLSSAALQVFSCSSDDQVMAIKATYRARYRATVDSLLSRRLVGPIHYQLRDIVLARCGFQPASHR